MYSDTGSQLVVCQLCLIGVSGLKLPSLSNRLGASENK